MNRFWRTVRHLDAGQVFSRIRLRAKAGLARAAPRAAVAIARRRAGPVPAVIRDPSTDVSLLRPCPVAHVESTAAEVASGRFRFLSERRDLGKEPFPAPEDASLLWAYHLEYMDYLLDLCVTGRAEHAGRLIRARWLTEGMPRASASHPYPESRRIASWLRVLPRLPEEDAALAAEGAWIWARRVANNLERDVNGNHLLENGLALALAGSVFAGRRAAILRYTAREILAAGARDQVLRDGSHFELSPMYHARVLGVLVEGGRALAAAGVEMPHDYWTTLARMTTFLSTVLDPRDELPLLGDTVRDPGFCPRTFLAAVRAVLPVPAPEGPGGDVHLPDCGLVRLQDAVAGHRLLLDAGPVCPDRLPAHGQADTFGFQLHADGVPFIVDAGLYEYAAGAMRDWCRSTRAHSTVTVDNEDSSEVWASFRVGRRARVRDIRWQLVDGRGTFSAEHDGYGHLGVIHARGVAHLESGLWLVWDVLRGRGNQAFASRLHLHPGVVLAKEAGAHVLHREGRRLTVVSFGADPADTEDGWHCPQFGVRRKSRLLRFLATGPRAAFGYVLAAGSGPAPSVRLDGGTVRVTRGGNTWTRRLP